MNARPHPVPLPKERVNRPPLSRDANATGVRAHFEVNLGAPAVATVLENFPDAALALSLSWGRGSGSGRAFL